VAISQCIQSFYKRCFFFSIMILVGQKLKGGVIRVKIDNTTTKIKENRMCRYTSHKKRTKHICMSTQKNE